MPEKTLKTRIIHKHDTEAHWLLAENFIPKQGELIVYDIDDTHTYERFKIGDGKTLVSALPFADTTYSEATTTTAGLMSAADKEKLDGLESSEPLPIEVDELPTENIDDSKIYVLKQSAKNAQLYYFGGINYHTLAEVVQDVVGVTPTVNYYVVSELPTSGEITDLQTFSVVNCYIFNNIAYVYGNAGAGNMWLTVSAIFAQMGNTVENKGRIYDLNNTSVEVGLYVYYEEPPKKFYLYNKKWEEIADGGIIDILSTSAENIQENFIYRIPNLTYINLTTSEAVMSKDVMLCNAVNTLPEVGNPAVVFDSSFSPQKVETYLLLSDNKVYGYADETLVQVAGTQGTTLTIGWYPEEVLFSLMDFTYGGIVYSLQELVDKINQGESISQLYLLFTYDIYTYKNGKFTILGVDTNKDYLWTGTNNFTNASFSNGVTFGNTDIGQQGNVWFGTKYVRFQTGTVAFNCQKNAYDEGGVVFNCPVDFSNATITGLPTCDIATESTAGLIKSTASTVTDGTQFPVTVDSDGKAYITLPVYNGEI